MCLESHFIEYCKSIGAQSETGREHEGDLFQEFTIEIALNFDLKFLALSIMHLIAMGSTLMTLVQNSLSSIL